MKELTLDELVRARRQKYFSISTSKDDELSRAPDDWITHCIGSPFTKCPLGAGTPVFTQPFQMDIVINTPIVKVILSGVYPVATGSDSAEDVNIDHTFNIGGIEVTSQSDSDVYQVELAIIRQPDYFESMTPEMKDRIVRFVKKYFW